VPLIERAPSIVQEDKINQRPVTALRQDDVEVPITIQIAHARVRSGFRAILEKDGRLE
jgi:hypothetical protein